jgi:hypothetical protein
MADDFENVYDLESLTDEDLQALVRQELAEYPDIDTDRLEIRAQDGQVTIGGRVGTEAEYQQIEHVLTDVIGVATTNEMVVDALVRQTQPEAADEANMQVYSGGSGRGGADRTEDSAEHLLQDTAAEQFGTDDMSEAIDRGQSYNPPDAPVQEGTWSREDH